MTPDQARQRSACLAFGLVVTLRESVGGTVPRKPPSGILNVPGNHGKGPILTRLLRGDSGGIPCFLWIEAATRSRESPKPSRNPQLLGDPGQGPLPRSNETQIQN